MERLVLVRCDGLLVEDEGATALRAFLEVLRTVEAYCPWVEPVRPGICTLPARGPSRYFGGEGPLVDRVREDLEALGKTGLEIGRVQVGVAEGLFAAGLAATAGVIVPPGETVRFLAGWPVGVLERPELTDLLRRLGLQNLGDLASLPGAHVLARFGSEGALCHRVARGEDGELAGLRVPGLRRRLASLKRSTGVPGADGPAAERQPGFWGGLDDQGRRAARSLAHVGELLGPEAVLTVRLQGGRGPADRIRLVPWDLSRAPVPSSGGETGSPWPGRLPPPAPAAVHRPPTPAEMTTAEGVPIRVSSRGILNATPGRLSVSGGPWTSVIGWAGPWPVEERWWARSGRRVARLQVVTGDGRAHLLAAERQAWRVEATYA